MKIRVILFLLLFVPAHVAALTAEVPLPDKEQETQAQALFQEFRCMACENQSIADSNSGLAADMRHLIRGKLSRGEGNAAIREFFISRYGSQILLTPPLQRTTILLWAGPLFFLLLGGLLLRRQFRR